MTFADIVRAELRRLGGAFWRGFWRTDLLFAALLGLAIVVDVLQRDPGAVTRDPLHALFTLVIGALYLLATAAVPGAFVGFFNMGRTAVGGWILLPLILVPLSLSVTLWLASDLLAARALAVVDAVGQALREHTWISASVGAAGHAGPVILVILLPLLLVDLGAALLDPGVFASIAALLLAVCAVLLAGTLPPALVSCVVLIGVYLRRVRALYK